MPHYALAQKVRWKSITLNSACQPVQMASTRPNSPNVSSADLTVSNAPRLLPVLNVLMATSWINIICANVDLDL